MYEHQTYFPFQYTTDKDGIIKGVTITRKAMLYHCRTLTVACSYQEAEIMVNVLDFKRDVGLWHSMQAVSHYKSQAKLYIKLKMLLLMDEVCPWIASFEGYIIR